jgi:hypothetical protein
MTPAMAVQIKWQNIRIERERKSPDKTKMTGLLTHPPSPSLLKQNCPVKGREK